MSEADEPAIQRGGIERLQRDLGGDPGDIKEFLSTFQASAARLVAAMQSAAATDGGAVEDAAHTLKASSGWIGARRLADLCQRLERRAREVSAGERVILVNTLSMEHARVEREVADALQRLS